MIKRGVLMPWIAISQSHGDAELALTLEATDGALGVLKQALDGKVEDFLEGPAIRPVFRSHN
jgi:glutamate-1-semialdehyde 2,1-aminomutase